MWTSIVLNSLTMSDVQCLVLCASDPQMVLVIEGGEEQLRFCHYFIVGLQLCWTYLFVLCLFWKLRWVSVLERQGKCSVYDPEVVDLSLVKLNSKVIWVLSKILFLIVL